jgi:hypothetical protein
MMSALTYDKLKKRVSESLSDQNKEFRKTVAEISENLKTSDSDRRYGARKKLTQPTSAGLTPTATLGIHGSKGDGG